MINIHDSYELLQQGDLTEIGGSMYLLRHRKSGARVLLLPCADENKVFAIGFRTPISDSTGVPHIIEHSVLCGSEKYPVQDPFMQLAKSSLNTFLNAMTYLDKTVYPVASCNDKDLKNLMSVYMDAVFKTRIYDQPKIFMQEGWHYEMKSPEDELKLNGVVYSEMKGAYSDPEDVLDRFCISSLYPDTGYGYDSGGDPEVIPTLTYENFLKFHREHYHPSNSYIYLYGDMDMAERLDWIDKEYLSKYDYLDVDTRVKYQQPFDRMREFTKYYSIADGESEQGKCWLSLQWSTGCVLDAELYQALAVLEFALLSSEGAPLKEALIKSGLGEDVFGGQIGELYQQMFKVTLKNCEADAKDDFVRVIDETLRQVVREGIDRQTLEAALNNLEFKTREADFGGYPKGIVYMDQAFDSWLYDDEAPVTHLRYEDTFRTLRSHMDDGYFEGLIQKYLIDNNHKSLVTLIPEAGLTSRREMELSKRLASYKAGLSAQEIEKIVRDSIELEEYQDTPDLSSDIAKIPVLGLSDIKREIVPCVTHEGVIGRIKALHHETDTKGITYLTLLYDISDFSREELETATIIREVLDCLDTENYSYAKLSTQIALTMGSLDVNISVRSLYGKDDFIPYFEVSAKYLHDKAQVSAQLINEIIRHTLYDDAGRLAEVMKMIRSRLEMKVAGSSHSLAAGRALSYGSKSAAYADYVSGIENIRYTYELAGRIDECADRLGERLAALSGKLFDSSRLIISITDDKAGYEISAEALKQALGCENGEGASESDLTFGGRGETAFVPQPVKKNEGFKTASQVNYVAMAGIAGAYSGQLEVLRNILAHEYLWGELRVKGGAYGALSRFSCMGNAMFVSYRDPNLASTLDVYRKMADYVASLDMDERTLTNFIISTVGAKSAPLTPAAWGSMCLDNYICGLPDEERQRFKDEIINCTLPGLRALSETIRSVISSEQVCVIGSASAVDASQDEFMKTENLL